MRPFCWLLLILPAAHAQPPDSKLTFEVASVKAAVPQAGRGLRKGGGGAGTADPSRFVRNSIPLGVLIQQAYGIKSYQLAGPPWIDSERYDIAAKVPDGTTKEQQSIMLQNLLAERFGLTVHRESREMQVYELVVAKGGPKFKPAEPAKDPAPPSGPPKIVMDPDGFPIIPASGGMIMAARNGRTIVSMRVDLTMALLAERLGSDVNRPVTDQTGLTGTYDIAAHWVADTSAAAAGPQAAPDPDPGPDLFQALQAQLGLKLEPKKAKVDVLVVDHAEKVPVEN